MMQLLVSEGYSWNVISEIWEGKVARYTQSLDCAVEGENIAFVMKSERRAQWAAAHQSADGTDYVAWARTEIPARRMAAPKGILPAAASHTAGHLVAVDGTRAEPGNGDTDEPYMITTGSGAARHGQWSSKKK